MSSQLTWDRERNSLTGKDSLIGPTELATQNLQGLREAAMTLLREVESLTTSCHRGLDRRLGLQEEVQRYEIELIRNALHRTRGNQRRAAKLLGVKVTTLNCKIKRFNISIDDDTAIAAVS